ncbi:glycosyltransferase [Xenophilus sp.]|uniref:glycosyltransferase n=1 Tax=Xenophilus sp. TaxID=1873499 RepID=UPI0037DCB69F
MHKLSGVVIAYNRADLVGTCLKALSFADELLVIDKSSTDGTAELAAPLADRVIVVPWSPVVEDTRAQAVAECTFDWILCLDDDECLSVEAVRFIKEELRQPRADVYRLPQRHYILGEHDERAYYWPEYQPRLFRRDAVEMRPTVHGGMVFDPARAWNVPPESGVCIHHLSHKDVTQWIEKTNRYTSVRDRRRAPHAGTDLAEFAHHSIDRYVGATRPHEKGSYPQAVAVLRSLYDIIDRLKTWEEENGRDGVREFQRICAELERQYARELPSPNRARTGRLEVVEAGAPSVEQASPGATGDRGTAEWLAQAVEGLRESIRAIRSASERELSDSRQRIAGIEAALVQERASAEAQALALAQSRAELAQAQARERDLEVRLGAAQAQTYASRAEYDALECELAGLKAEADHFRTALEAVSAQLHATLSSTSWRAMAPLRTFSSRHPGVHRALGRILRFGWRLLQGRPREAMDALKGRGMAAAGLVAATASLPPPAPPPVRFERFRVRSIEPAARGPASEGAPASGHRILCVSHVLPYPPRAGNAYRIERMLGWLRAQGHEVVLVVCPLPGEAPTPQQVHDAARVCPRLLVLHRTGQIDANFAEAEAWLAALPGKPRDFRALLREDKAGLPSTAVRDICRTFCPDALAELVLAMDAAFSPQILLAQYIFMTRPFALLRGELLKIVDTHDVFSTKAHKVAQYGIDDVLALGEEEEAALLARADVVIGIQPEETAHLRRLVPQRKVVNAGADFPVDADIGPPPGQGRVLLVASDNPMNNKGLRDFLRFAWPLVRRECPHAQLHVAGDVGRAVEVVPEGVHILGRVEALRAAYAQADVVINPTVAGTGLKIKTVEALCHLRPVVAFPTGADGVGPGALAFLRVARNWYEFAALLTQALREPPHAQLAAQAEALVREFSASTVYAELAGVLHGE